MRLRYLHLQNYQPISDIKVCFASGSPLARDCAIRFVVGVNGSGKSNLLRAVAEVFLALADLRVPPFPVSLVYELGVRGSPNHRTLLLHCPGGRQQASLWLHERFAFDDGNGQEVFEACIEHLDVKDVPTVPGFAALIAPGDWPLRDSTPPLMALPSAVLAYTTGDLRPWRSVWSRNQDAQGLLESNEEELGDERPAGWTNAQEALLEAARQEPRGTAKNSQDLAATDSDSFRRPILLDATLLKCALLAVALPQAFIETADYPDRAEVDAAMAKLRKRDDNKNALQELLERGGWHHLVSVDFRSCLQTAAWDRKMRETAHDWWLCAGEVITEPHPLEARRNVVFDLKGAFSPLGLSFRSAARVELATCATQGEALWALLGGAKDATSFELFTRLLELNQAGLFDDVLLRLRRQPAPDAGSDLVEQDIGVLRYEELSDGEQMFLGRMALLHLLQGQHDSLLLLDEPETHFNDLWKRDMVSIVDDALADTSAEVLIATHAALMLTDALKEELVVLERVQPDAAKLPSDTSIRVLDREIHTFGATGDHPLRDIFGASDTVGRRASRLLEVLIAAASMAEELDACWARNEGAGQELAARVLVLASETETGLTIQSVGDYLRSIETFARHFGAERPLRMKAVLETFICQTGPGYFQVELKRAWRRLQEVAPHVA
jgi:ABC-type transport system involved in cytochrome c biogenesis ATPase subunit